MDELAATPDPPALGWRATLALLRRLPAAGLSRALGRLADVPLPRPVRAPALRLFARGVGADLGEVEKPLADYPSVNAFFVRRLRPGARTWPAEARAAGSPVDGIVGKVGTIHAGTAVQAKGRGYPIAELLRDEAEATALEGGLFVTLYLAPRHYHRVHAPLGGTLSVARHVPGEVFPVNPPTVAHVPGLFARNERLLCRIESDGGTLWVVAVGAYNVARISAAFDPAWSGEKAWVSNRREPLPRERIYRPPLSVERGEELMAFHLGSTVILLFSPGSVDPAPACRPGREVRLGEALARPSRPEQRSPAPANRRRDSVPRPDTEES